MDAGVSVGSAAASAASASAADFHNNGFPFIIGFLVLMDYPLQGIFLYNASERLGELGRRRPPLRGPLRGLGGLRHLYAMCEPMCI